MSTNNEICEENDSKNDTCRRLGMFCRSNKGEKCDIENSSARKSDHYFMSENSLKFSNFA